MDARQKEGSDYESNNLANYQGRLWQYLKYGYSLINLRNLSARKSPQNISRSSSVTKGKEISHTSPRGSHLSMSSFCTNMGISATINRRVCLVNLVSLNNMKTFGHWTGFHESTLKWGDIHVLVTNTALEYLVSMCKDTGDLNAKTKYGSTDSNVYATQHAPQICLHPGL